MVIPNETTVQLSELWWSRHGRDEVTGDQTGNAYSQPAPTGEKGIYA